MQKRRGDKGVARATGVRFRDGTTADVDLLRSPREVDAARVFAAMVLVRDAAAHHLVVHSVRRDQWGPPGGWREPPETVRENAVRELREETGLEVASADLVPVGYERFHHRSSGGSWRSGQDLMQLYVVDLPGDRPAARCGPRRRRRLPVGDLGRLRGAVRQGLLLAGPRRGPQAASRVSSRARFSRAAGSHVASGVLGAVDVRAHEEGPQHRRPRRGVRRRGNVPVLVTHLAAVLVEAADGCREDPQVGVVEDDPGRVVADVPEVVRPRCPGRASRPWRRGPCGPRGPRVHGRPAPRCPARSRRGRPPSRPRRGTRRRGGRRTARGGAGPPHGSVPRSPPSTSTRWVTPW